MNRFTRLVVAAACSLPILAIAQTGGTMAPPAKVVPADQPSSDLQKQKTEQTGNATQYGQPGTANSSQTTPATAKVKHAKARKTTPPATDSTAAPATPQS